MKIYVLKAKICGESDKPDVLLGIDEFETIEDATHRAAELLHRYCENENTTDLVYSYSATPLSSL